MGQVVLREEHWHTQSIGDRLARSGRITRFVSEASVGLGGFVAHIVSKPSRIPGSVGDNTRVQVEGRAFYTGFMTFVIEAADGISGSGFIL